MRDFSLWVLSLIGRVLISAGEGIAWVGRRWVEAARERSRKIGK